MTALVVIDLKNFYVLQATEIDLRHYRSTREIFFASIVVQLGLKKTWIPACPYDKYLSNACPGQVLVCSFNDLVDRQLAWFLKHLAKKDYKVLMPRMKIYLSW